MKVLFKAFGAVLISIGLIVATQLTIYSMDESEIKSVSIGDKYHSVNKDPFVPEQEYIEIDIKEYYILYTSIYVTETKTNSSHVTQFLIRKEKYEQ